MGKMFNPPHPGESLKLMFIDEGNHSVTELAKKLGIARVTLSRLFNGKCGISAEMALRLSKLLPNTDMEFWLNQQRDYDIWQMKLQSNKIKVKPLRAA